MKKILTLIFATALSASALADNATAVADGKLFTSNNNDVSTTNPTHRIPAIACKGDTIIAICDERYGTNGGDIGSGRIDLVCRISTDNGKTWSEKQTVALGGKDFSGNTSDNFGYGDAAVCIDRTTGKILVMAAAGATSYSSSKVTSSRNGSNYSNALRVAKIVGTPTVDDDGKITSISWDQPSDVTSTVYGACSNLSIAKAFFGSGRICQSTLIKNGKNASYRIYAALTTDKGSVVVYSDDFGNTWSSLGVGAKDGDEAKVEELPNGDVLLCAKNYSGSGRIFNIYKYTDVAQNTGVWQTATSSNITAAKCNGEIYLVLATNKDNTSSNYGKEAYVALMSVPADNNDRKNVSIYWKAINGNDDTNEVTDYTNTSNWTKYEVSNTTSAYSTMRQDGNGDIAFLYEENNYAHSNTEAYDIVFKTISLSAITSGKYTADDPWENRVVTLKAKIKKGETTNEYYLHCKETTDGTAQVSLELVNANNVTDMNYSYYWVISKTPANAVNDTYYYLSNLKGAGYLGQVMAINGQTGNTERNGAGATDDYNYEFKIRTFVKKGVQQNSHTDTSDYPNIAVTGYSINFLDLYDNTKYKNKYVAVSENGAVNWYDHTTTGENMNGAGTYWSTDFEIADVTRINPNEVENPSCGTKDNPTEYGFPVTFTRHDNNYKLNTFEDYHYYATLKLPFAVSLPKNVTAYKVTDKKPASDANNTYEVGLAKLDLKQSTNVDSDGNAAYVLPRETPVLLMMTNENAGNDGKTAPTDQEVQKTVYLTPEKAQVIQETNFKGTLGARTLTTSEYNPSQNPNLFLLSKKNGRVAFRYLTGTKINANKAYYVYDGDASAKNFSFVFEDNETTRIDRVLPIVADDDNAPVYDLMGRRVMNPSNGIYIKNGKKFVVE